MFFSVDTVDCGMARLVAEDGEVSFVSDDLLAEGVHPGDMVFLQQGVYEKDEALTQQRKQYIECLLRELLGEEK